MQALQFIAIFVACNAAQESSPCSCDFAAVLMRLSRHPYAVNVTATHLAVLPFSFCTHSQANRHIKLRKRRQLRVIVAASSSEQQLPDQLIKARKLKSAGLATSAVLVGAALSVATAQDIPLPAVPSWLIWGLAAIGFGSAALLVVAAQEGLQFELHNGRLYIQWGSPNEGALVAPGSIEV